MTDQDERIDIEAFSVLAHEIRLGVLQAFFDHVRALDEQPDRDERGLTYSELMDAVGTADSGKFNYHLDRLRGIYVEQIGDRYVPTASAVALFRAILANRPTVEATETEFGAVCPACSSPVTARYEQERLIVDCPDCEEWWGLSYPFPKHGLENHADDLLTALSDRAHHDVSLARTGQCPACAGRVDATIPRDTLDGERDPTVEFACGACLWEATIDALNALRFEPRVAAALVELDVLPDGEASDDPQMTGRVESESPFRAVIDIETETGHASIVVDGTLDVHSVTVDSPK